MGDRGVEVRRWSVDELPDAAWSFLLEREAEENVIFGILDRVRDDPNFYGDGYRLWAVSSEANIAAVVLRTPPHNLILSRVTDPGAYPMIARIVSKEWESIPGVLVHAASGTPFLAAWRETSGQAGRLALSERTMAATDVIRPDTPGSLLRGSFEDLDLLVQWYEAFEHEALPEGMPKVAHRPILEKRISESHAGPFLWMVDGVPVATAGAGGMTPNGIRIGAVYTPPELRERGYGSAVTAALTEKMLKSHRFCFLETDASNPTSNRIYERMGYRFVCDHAMYLFDPA